MNIAITIELQFFMISILWGAILLLVYDFLRIFRRLIKHNSFFLAFEDLIFWISASVFIFAMLYVRNNGIIRGFSVMGMGIGMVLYHYILSEILISLITKFIYTLFGPVRFVIRQVKKGLRLFKVKTGKLGAFFLNRLKKANKSVKIKLMKKKQIRADKRKLKEQKKAAKNQEAARRKAAKKDTAKASKRQTSNKQALNDNISGSESARTGALNNPDITVGNSKRRTVQLVPVQKKKS